MSFIALLSMRVEPPKVGIGRVHSISYDAPPGCDDIAPEIATNRYEAMAQCRERMLDLIYYGTCGKAAIAKQLGVSKTTIDNRAMELILAGLIKKRIVKHHTYYTITGDGILKVLKR